MKHLLTPGIIELAAMACQEDDPAPEGYDTFRPAGHRKISYTYYSEDTTVPDAISLRLNFLRYGPVRFF